LAGGAAELSPVGRESEVCCDCCGCGFCASDVCGQTAAGDERRRKRAIALGVLFKSSDLHRIKPWSETARRLPLP
jgi:hypothetical protein